VKLPSIGEYFITTDGLLNESGTYLPPRSSLISLKPQVEEFVTVCAGYRETSISGLSTDG